MDSLPVGAFVRLLSHAFTTEPLSFDEGWKTLGTPEALEVLGFAGWEATLIRQIIDLREMDEIRSLTNELRYFGIEAPRGSYWYNFDPASFLECGMAGTFGGWEQDNSTGRVYVLGQVAVLDANGRIVSSNPEDIGDPVFEVPRVSWERFAQFLECGQAYE